MTRSLLLAAGMFSLTACELPPREAWRVIQTEGLIPYLGIEWGPRPVPAYVRSSSARQQQPRTLAAAYAPAARPAVPAMSGLAGNRFLAVGPARSGIIEKKLAVPGVYMARTSPAPAKPATVAAAPAKRPSEPAKAPKTITLTGPAAEKSSTVPKATAARPQTTAPSAKEIAQAPAAKAPQTPSKKTESTHSAASANAVKAGDSTPVPNPKKAPPQPVQPAVSQSPAKEPAAKAEELPFGTPVPGRPGLVNSPYAGKYQLVDVTGLNTGQEIKCPYSGKLFRVPPAAQATNTLKNTSEPPPQSNKEKK